MALVGTVGRSGQPHNFGFEVCPASSKKCIHCGLLNRFAEVCRKEQSFNKNTQQGNRINNIENNEKTENSVNDNVIFMNYNERYDAQYDPSDNNYVAMLELKLQLNRTAKHE